VLVVLVAQQERLSGDGWEYSRQATQMLHGNMFLNPLTGRADAAHPPAWIVVLAAFMWLGGHTWLQQQLLACLIGTATVVLIGLAGRRIGGDRVGLVAAGIAAVYAGLWVYERALLSETLLLPIIALMVLIVYRFRDRPSGSSAMLLGAVCALLALIRSEQILLLPLLVVPLTLMARQLVWRRRVVLLGLAIVSLLVVLAPWTIYNLGRFRQPVLLSTGFGAAALQGNCDGSYYGAYTGWPDFGCVLRGSNNHDAALADSEDRRLALTYAENHLGRLPVVLAAREGRVFGLWSPLQQSVLESRSFVDLLPASGKAVDQPADLWVVRLGLFSYWLLLVPAVVGAILLRRQRITVYPLVAFVGTVVIATAVTFGDTRYAAAAQVPIIVLASIAVDALLPSKRSSSGKGRAHPQGHDPAPAPDDRGGAPEVGIGAGSKTHATLLVRS
jgi:4-amino-4-deoxy-L-arabinose transferase-like glycosyltransferase